MSLEFGPVEAVRQTTDAGEAVDLHRQRVGFHGLTLTRKWAGPAAGPLTDRRIVLVHGFAQNRYTWHASTRSLSAWLAAQGYDVWNLELRGHGLSRGQTPAEARAGRFSAYVDDAATLAEALGPAFWLGHSLGGAVSYAAATRAQMRGVVGIGGLYSFAQANKSLNLLCQLSRLFGAGGDRAAAVLGTLSVKTRLAGQLLGRLYGISDVAGYAFPISGWAPGSMEPELLAERMERGFDWTNLSIWMDMAKWGQTGSPEWDADWAATQLPVLVVAGDLDHLMPPSDARMAYDRSGSHDKTWMLLDDYATGHHWGHVDLLLGKHARQFVWEPLRDWMAVR